MKLKLLFISLLFSFGLKAQFLVQAPPAKDTLPTHWHPDSMYAKVVVDIFVSPNKENRYELAKVLCYGCDSARIAYMKEESVRIAKEQKGLKTNKTAYGQETSMKYVLPLTFLLPRYGEYPAKKQ